MLPSGYTDDEIFWTVVESPRDAFVALPDMHVIERAGWKQIITPSFARGGFNEVAHAALDEADADHVIAETIARYRNAGIAFRWNVGPDSAPADLAARLAGAGLRATFSIGLARATLPLSSRGESLVEVRAVDAATLDVYTWVSATGWGMDIGPLGVAYAAMLADPARRHRLFLATVDGEPAGAASYVVFPRSVHLLNAVVLEPYRRRGVYRTLVQARLDDARAEGLDLATTQAMVETSGRCCESSDSSRSAASRRSMGDHAPRIIPDEGPALVVPAQRRPRVGRSPQNARLGRSSGFCLDH